MAGAESKRRTFIWDRGEMLVAQPGRPPVIAQFDIPASFAPARWSRAFRTRFLTSGTGSSIAEYRADERRGFIEQRNVLVSESARAGRLGPDTTLPIEARLTLVWRSLVMKGQSTSSGGGGFVNVGSTALFAVSSFGILRPTLICI